MQDYSSAIYLATFTLRSPTFAITTFSAAGASTLVTPSTAFVLVMRRPEQSLFCCKILCKYKNYQPLKLELFQ